jgi:dTDP-4-dehydrorhamnose reductase
MKKIIIIGAKGQLGQYLVDVFANENTEKAQKFELISLSREQLDLTNLDTIKPRLKSFQADLIINATAYTAVDKAESEPELAMLVNARAPKEMAEAAAELDIPFIHYSTDYVFSGNAKEPYPIDHATDPQGEYGKTKLAGENNILATGALAYIFRTAWVYSNKGNNFYKTMLRLAEDRDQLNVVIDQVGSPTFAKSIAEATLQIVIKLLACTDTTSMRDAYPNGIFHMTNNGQVSWAGFAQEIFRLHHLEVNVNGIPSEEYPTPAKRPAYSVLDNQRLFDVFGVALDDWQIALQKCSAERQS